MLLMYLYYINEICVFLTFFVYGSSADVIFIYFTVLTLYTLHNCIHNKENLKRQDSGDNI